MWRLLPLWLVACATAHDPAKQPDGSIQFFPDASGSDPDAREVQPGDPDARPQIGTPDATPVSGTPDAALPPPPIDADLPCTTSVVQVLVNPSFDSGPGGGWLESSGGGYPIVVVQDDGDGVLEDGETLAAVPPHTPTWDVWMGGYFDGVDTLTQTFTVPAGATALEVVGYRFFASEELDSGYDTFTMQLRTTGGGVLETLVNWDAIDMTDAWTPFSFPTAASYAGQTIQIHVTASVDFAFNTNFFLDTFAVRATVCM